MKKFDTWLLVVRLINRLKKRKKGIKYGKLREAHSGECDLSERQDNSLLQQAHSSTNPVHAEEVEVEIGEDSFVSESQDHISPGSPPQQSNIEGHSGIAPIPEHPVQHMEIEIPGARSYGSDAFLKLATPSEAATQYSTDSVHSSLEDELVKLEGLLQPDGPFRTAAVLRDAVVGLGSLTRKLDQLMEEDPTVEDCPADVEMLVRRAGELFTALQDFASRKGIPVPTGAMKTRSRSNPELFFEDNAPWLNMPRKDSPIAWARSEMGYKCSGRMSSQSFSDTSQKS